jgi:hypothetical protein
MLVGMSIFGQSSTPGKTSVSVTIAATVINQIQMITIADIDVGTVIPSDDILRLDPRTDQGAGIIMIQGRENASIQISYSAQVAMVNASTNADLVVDYTVCGNLENRQPTSVLFTSNPTTVTLNNNGEYFLFVGCSFSMSELVSGQYDGDFVVEVDYN